jgi:hypothetical protein
LLWVQISRRGNRRAGRELFGPVEEERSCVRGLPTCGLGGLRQTFDLLDKISLGIGEDNCPRLQGQINIVKYQLKLKENLNEIQVEISQLKEIDVTQIDKWLVKPNLKLQSVKFADKRIEDSITKNSEETLSVRGKGYTRAS